MEGEITSRPEDGKGDWKNLVFRGKSEQAGPQKARRARENR